MHGDGAKEILSGCECGSKYFFFISKRAMEKAQKVTEDLTQENRKEIEQEITELIEGKTDLRDTIFLDIETVKVTGPGKYEIDLVSLFKKRPLIYKLADGKYMVDIVSAFEAKEY